MSAMKCERCGLPGGIVGPQTTTCMYFSPTVDREGNVHNHDGNIRTGNAQCANGHVWAVTIPNRCSVSGCEWNNR